VAQGVTPRVEEAAALAAIARATAYRYFPNQRVLLLAAHPEIEVRSLLPEPAPEDPAARLDAVIAAFVQLIVTTEAQQRTILRFSVLQCHLRIMSRRSTERQEPTRPAGSVPRLPHDASGDNTPLPFARDQRGLATPSRNRPPA
jgi:hypothetical protein